MQNTNDLRRISNEETMTFFHGLKLALNRRHDSCQKLTLVIVNVDDVVCVCRAGVWAGARGVSSKKSMGGK